MWAVTSILRDIEDVVHYKSGRVKAERRNDRIDRAPIQQRDLIIHQTARDEESSQRITGDGKKIRSAEKVEPGFHVPASLIQFRSELTGFSRMEGR